MTITPRTVRELEKRIKDNERRIEVLEKYLTLLAHLEEVTE